MEQQMLERKLNQSIQKEKAINLNSKKSREEFRRQYEEMLGTARKTADTFGLSYANAFRNTTIHNKITLRMEMKKQKTITNDRKMIETHKGKSSKQEEAAIQRGTYSDYSYDHGTAGNVLEKYREKKQQKEAGQASQTYQCTGKEFLLPPAQNMDGDMAEQIANVMMERDRIKAMTKGTTPLSKASYAVNQEFLAVMEDVIKTYFTANGVKQDGKGAVKEKDKKAARQHMPLALEKYELFARTKNEKIAARLEAGLKKTNAYKAKKRETENALANDPALSYAEKLTELKQLIGSNPELYSKNEKIIAQVMAEFEALRKRMNQIYTEYNTAKGALDDNAVGGGEDPDALEAVKSELARRFSEESKMLKTGMSSCGSYLQFLFQDEAMPAMERTYIKARFGKSADVRGRSEAGPALKMDVPLSKQMAGLSEYDEQMKAELEAYQQSLSEKERKKNEGRPFMYMFSSYKKATMTKHNMGEFRRVSKLQDELQKKYDTGSARGLRDMAELYTPILKDQHVAVDDKQFEQFVKDSYVMKYGKNCVLGDNGAPVEHQELSKEEVYETFHRMLPKFREASAELAEFRKTVPTFEEPANLEHYTKDYDFYKTLQAKSEALGYEMEVLSENKKLMSMITDEEKDELIKLRSEAAAMDVMLGQWYSTFNALTNLTPQQYMDGAAEKIMQGNPMKLLTFQEQLEISRGNATKKFQKKVDDARKG